MSSHGHERNGRGHHGGRGDDVAVVAAAVGRRQEVRLFPRGVPIDVTLAAAVVEELEEGVSKVAVEEAVEEGVGDRGRDAGPHEGVVEGGGGRGEGRRGGQDPHEEGQEERGREEERDDVDCGVGLGHGQTPPRGRGGQEEGPEEGDQGHRDGNQDKEGEEGDPESVMIPPSLEGGANVQGTLLPLLLPQGDQDQDDGRIHDPDAEADEGDSQPRKEGRDEGIHGEEHEGVQVDQETRLDQRPLQATQAPHSGHDSDAHRGQDSRRHEEVSKGSGGQECVAHSLQRRHYGQSREEEERPEGPGNRDEGQQQELQEPRLVSLVEF